MLHQFLAHMLDARGQDVTFQGGCLRVVVWPFVSHCTLVQPVAPIPDITQINATLRDTKLRRPDGADNGVSGPLGFNKLLQQATILASIEKEMVEASAVEILDAGIIIVARSTRGRKGRGGGC